MEEQIKREPLYQVWATETKTGQLVAVPMFPRMIKEAAENFVQTMKDQIALGNEKRFVEPQALLHLPS